MVEEAASAASSMNFEAEKLTDALDVFKLSNSGVTAARMSHTPDRMLKIANDS